MAELADRQKIEEQVRSFPTWHYEFDLDGVTTPIFDRGHVNRHQQRRSYFFDPLVELCGGSLRGKRVLDLGCNAGYWALAAIESGCDYVVGVDGRQMLIDQAELVFSTKGVDRSRYAFNTANVFDEDLLRGEEFDVVLCLGLLYHVSQPMGLFERMAAWSRDLLVVDTSLSLAPGAYLEIRRERLDDPRTSVVHELVMYPTKKAVDELARQAGFSTVMLKPEFTSYEGCEDYRRAERRAFLCTRHTPLERAELRVEALGVGTDVRDALSWGTGTIRGVVRKALGRR